MVLKNGVFDLFLSFFFVLISQLANVLEIDLDLVKVSVLL